MVSGINLEVLKVPLGFIRVLQLPFLILALATINAWHLSLDYKCDGGFHDNPEIDTFGFNSVALKCDNVSKPFMFASVSYSSNCGFYVFTAVITLLFVLIVLFTYLVLWPLYESDARLPKIDFVGTAILGFLWLIATIVWWSGASKVSSLTSNERIRDLMNVNCGQNCTTNSGAHNGGIVIAVIAGWALVILFAADVWFTFKETIWFRSRHEAHQPTMSPSSQPYH